MLKKIIAPALLCGLTMLATDSRGQAGGGGQGSADDQQAIQQMQEIGAQMMQRIQQSGADPQQLFQDMREQTQNGTFDPAAFQQKLIDQGILDQQLVNRMQSTVQRLALSRIKQQLDAGDEEWTVLMPKLQKVIAALADAGQLDQLGGAGFLIGGSGPNVEISKALKELKDAEADKEISPTVISGKLRTLRDARAKYRGLLVAARKDLSSVVTVHQEAVLLGMGIIE